MNAERPSGCTAAASSESSFFISPRSFSAFILHNSALCGDNVRRIVVDGEAPMGVDATRSLERVAAALGQLEQAQPLFEPADDIPNGGVLCALPALLAFGLLRHAASH